MWFKCAMWITSSQMRGSTHRVVKRAGSFAMRMWSLVDLTQASLRATSKPHFWGEDLSAFSHASCLMGDPVGSSALRNRLCCTIMQEKRCGCKIAEMKWKTWSPQSKWEVLVLQNNTLVLHFALQNKACVSYPCPLKRFDVMGSSGTVSTRSTHIVVSKPHF